MHEHLRVIVADDNPVVRAGLTALLSGREDIDVAAQAADGREACEAAVRHRPDVILLDVRMPGVDGITALPHLVRIAPVLMTTYSRESDIVHEALRLGACGYLVHGEFTADQLVDAVRDAKLGRPHFTHTASNALLATVRGGYAPATPHRAASSATRKAFAGTPSQQQADMAHSLLSQREGEVMDLIASGMTNQQIAATCFISQKTVKNHINRIFAKLNAASRGQAIAIWHGLSPTQGGPTHG
ncbi:response regulator transcription factor [Streptomyces lavendulocolor]|uniref:response regulator transcription factor n=1 Tax=Streptomyces lavendulocolor TaxID=67316 RepID=UPI0031D8CEA8